VKYPEANNMHKKMYRVSGKIESLKKDLAANKHSKLAEAEDLLFQGQCNCPYWHGVFGGLYLNHLRYATYNRLIQAETLADKLGVLPKDGLIEISDFDDDGRPEILVETEQLNAYFSPRFGGNLFELDIKDRGFNLLDTMTRREEGYHYKLTEAKSGNATAGKTIHDRVEVKEAGLEKYLIYDWHQRKSFVDHIMPFTNKLEDFKANTYHELGDFILEPFEFETSKGPTGLKAVFSRDGHIYYPNGASHLRITKSFVFPKNRRALEATYDLENLSGTESGFVLGVEMNWTLLAGDAPDRYYYVDKATLSDTRMNSTGENAAVKSFGLVDEYHRLNIKISLSEPCLLWRMPIETISLSEGGFERVYQSSLTCPCFDIRLGPAQKRQLTIKIEFLDS
jgi:hypothetical protein